MDEQDRVYVEHLRDVLTNCAYVEDEGAVAVFRNGGIVFDLSPAGRRLDAFLRKNPALKAVTQFSASYPDGGDGAYRVIGGVVPNRSVYVIHKKPGTTF
jgi:hypothetical protein